MQNHRKGIERDRERGIARLYKWLLTIATSLTFCPKFSFALYCSCFFSCNWHFYITCRFLKLYKQSCSNLSKNTNINPSTWNECMPNQHEWVYTLSRSLICERLAPNFRSFKKGGTWEALPPDWEAFILFGATSQGL